MKLTTLALALCAATTVNANLLTNGSFEQNDLGFNGVGIYNNVPTGMASLQGWNVGSPVDLYGNLSVAEDGTYSIDLAGTPSVGQISQTFTTVVGQEYQVTFWMSGNPMYGSVSESPIETMRVSVDSVANNYTWNAQLMNNTLTNMEWEEQSFTYTATSASDTIAFLSTENSRYTGVNIDNVSVEATPEPFTVWFLLAGAASLVFLRKQASR